MSSCKISLPNISSTSVSKRSSDVKEMFSRIASRYDFANSVLSFGIHKLWRRQLLNLLPSNLNARTLDLCSGTGDLLAPLGKRFGNVVGADFCFPMLLRSRERSSGGFPLIQGDALRLPFMDESFDLVTVAFGVRNFENLRSGLREINRVLKPKGKLLVLEFGQPNGLVFGPLYRMYSKFVLPFLGGLLTGDRTAYEYLPSTAATFPAGKMFESELQRSGFSVSEVKELTFGIAYAYLAESTANV